MRRGALALAAGLIVVAVCVMLGRGGDATDGLRAVRHAPPADLPRLSDIADPTYLADAALVLEFDATSDRLALLDPMNARVHLLHRTPSGWESDVTFGRRGEGPGELRSPSGIAFTADGGLVIADEVGLHFFTAGGEYVRRTTPRNTCMLQRPGVAVARAGVLLHGTCSGKDTVVAALYWSGNGEDFIEIATDVRYTRDGRFGSYLGSLSALSEGSGRYLFGTGSANCIYEVRDDGPHNAATRLCDLTAERYRAPAPRALQERIRREGARRPELRRLLQWPDPLPVYVAAMAMEEAVLVRPFSADSVVFEVAGSRRELLVAPQKGLVSCRRHACLWTEHVMDGVRLTLLRTQRVAEAVASQGSGR